MKFTTSNLSIAAGALVLALGAYWFFFTGTGNQPPLSVTTTGNEAQSRFQTLLSELGPVTFDTSVFSDPRFNALVDLSTPITPESSGRPDPFAAIPGVTGQ